MTFLAGAKINKGDLLEVRDDGLLYPIRRRVPPHSEPAPPQKTPLMKTNIWWVPIEDSFFYRFKNFFGCGGCKPASTIPDLPYEMDLTDEDNAMLSREFNRQVSRMNP